MTTTPPAAAMKPQSVTVETRGGMWENQWSPLKSLYPTDARLTHNSCRSAYNRITRILHHRHQMVIDYGVTPARRRSPANLARKACGDTKTTSSRASVSPKCSAAKSASYNHALHCVRDGVCPNTDANTYDSPAPSSWSKCHFSTASRAR